MTMEYIGFDLSPNFHFSEAIATNHREINNYPPLALFSNLAITAKNMERVRSALGDRTILVSSWYRCEALNTAVGGSKTSDHMTGMAVDFTCPRFGTPANICKHLASIETLAFKQLIYEHTWVHISFYNIPTANPKREVLTLLANKSYGPGITDKQGNPL